MCHSPPRMQADDNPKNRYSKFAVGRVGSLLNNVNTVQKTQPKSTAGLYYQAAISFIENYRRQIFWATLYTLVLFGVFIERGYCK